MAAIGRPVVWWKAFGRVAIMQLYLIIIPRGLIWWSGNMRAAIYHGLAYHQGKLAQIRQRFSQLKP